MSKDPSTWVGKTKETTDLIAPWPAAALRATLDLDDPPLQDGDPLPPLWHWLYFLATSPGSNLGPEGHPKMGGFLPPILLPRRMFAGGRFEFRSALLVGAPATQTSTVVSVQEKTGRSGPLTFLTVRSEVIQAGHAILTEERDLVYREPPRGSQLPAPGDEEPPAAPWRQTFHPDETALFRFSALTFNSHRIHYDHPYTTGVEGYPGLVVHGPLMALLLADLARRNGSGTMSKFSFRGRSPLFVGHPVYLLGTPTDPEHAELEAWSHDRRLAVTAKAEFTVGVSEP